ncbi:NAD-dependent epimerase/dehydratase family protein [Cesiribacter andamanensis]|uniref:Putative epimerase/dehydratase n=1 Tax=Cesiribacter andamanensis AMV16 TaxID=1279009 RepID=M7P1P6_9BACT|nr:NAD-dependent epimerase/dehydratase family protein [Cesiribacter andamanensis]EMR04529.1 putative epimerase/dehydratase [Cesiribacter andamanensis AMV16]
MEKVLVIGANGQLGSELTDALREKWGRENVLATDIRQPRQLAGGDRFELLDALDKEGLYRLIKQEGTTQIYHLAAVLSATGEKNPHFAWKLNMESLFNVLEAARELKVGKTYWPSSIAVFGPDTPKKDVPQYTVCNPTTIYGISKLAGEQWCEYYWKKWGVDVRSLRYPGLIGYKALPGGGTTDYAVDIYHKALEGEDYTCFLAKGTYLPMMYMPDAIQATLQLMDAPADSLRIRSSYNLGALSFDPEEIAASIRRHLPQFQIRYQPDFRQQIADSWPDSINDSYARQDWNWQPAYNLDRMTQDMLENLRVLKEEGHFA